MQNAPKMEHAVLAEPLLGRGASVDPVLKHLVRRIAKAQGCDIGRLRTPGSRYSRLVAVANGSSDSRLVDAGNCIAKRVAR